MTFVDVFRPQGSTISESHCYIPDVSTWSFLRHALFSSSHPEGPSLQFSRHVPHTLRHTSVAPPNTSTPTTQNSRGAPTYNPSRIFILRCAVSLAFYTATLLIVHAIPSSACAAAAAVTSSSYLRCTTRPIISSGLGNTYFSSRARVRRRCRIYLRCRSATRLHRSCCNVSASTTTSTPTAAAAAAAATLRTRAEA